MSRSWNGSSLVTELSALLGDTSTAYQTRVLGWLNDIIFDISTKHDWPLHEVKGKKKLTTSQELQPLEIAAPGAATIALASGGSLVSGTSYSILCTFAQDNGVETIAGVVSNSVTATGATLSLNVTSLPVSTETLVTKRKIYLSNDGLSWFYYSTISDNTTTIATITAPTTSTIQSPDYESIRKLKSSPFSESLGIYLKYKDEDQLRIASNGNFTSGTPEYFAPKGDNAIILYPIPSIAIDLSFNYYRNPFRLYNATSSQPDLPIYLKEALKAGVIAMGFEYRDRSGQEIKKANYVNELSDAINRTGRVADIQYQVKDVTGNSNGFEVT